MARGGQDFEKAGRKFGAVSIGKVKIEPESVQGARFLIEQKTLAIVARLHILVEDEQAPEFPADV